MSEWISVDERLPEKGQGILVVWEGQVTSFIAPGGWMGKYITHWMPLPDPPQQENSE